MVACILVQIILALVLIVMVQLFQTKNFDFVMIGTYSACDLATSILLISGSSWQPF